MDAETYLKRTFIFLFVIFITIYIFYGNSYYNYDLHKKVELTNEQIEKFENDIKNNNNIDINDYIGNTVPDYSNNISDLGLTFSNFTSKYVKEGIKGVLDIIGSLMG